MKNLFLKKYDNSRLILILIIIVLIGGFILRGIYLTADPPKDITISGGIISDPGQYSYGARNKVLFNKWSFAEFKPYAFSPVFNLVNYFIYKYMGISLVTHRLIPLVFSCLILFLLTYLSWKIVAPQAALFTSIFLAFNYPIIIYSKIGYREYPMTFFIIFSFYYFSQAVKKDSIILYLLSSFFFFLGFLTKGSGGYLISVFFVTGAIWLFEKKIKIGRLLFFFSSFILFMSGWYFVIYKNFSAILDTFIRDNKNVRHLRSISKIIENLYNSPFMLNMKSDPIVLVIAILFLLIYSYWRFRRKTQIHPFTEISIFWLLAGMFFHGMVNYRPTRFYLLLMIPVAYLAGLFLYHLWNRKIFLPINCFSILAIIVIIPVFIALGVHLFFKYFSEQFILIQILFYLLLILVIFSVFLKKRLPMVSKVTVSLILLFSLSSNYVFIKKWVTDREYQIKRISTILSKAIPQAKIAGNWASILSIGTMHKTYYAWKNFFNWNRDFLSKNKIEYLLLAKGPFANELKDYQRFFIKEFKNANLVAQFPLFTAQVYLFKLNTVSSTKIECETLSRSSGHVQYRNEASSNMIVSIDKIKAPYLANLSRNLSIKVKKGSQLIIKAYGSFSLKIVLRGKTTIEKNILFNNQNSLREKKIYRFSSDLCFSRIELQVLKQRGTIYLDYLDFVNSTSIFPNLKNTTNKNYSLFFNKKKDTLMN